MWAHIQVAERGPGDDCVFLDLAAGLALGVALAGVPWHVHGVMLAGTPEYYHQQQERLTAAFSLAFPSTGETPSWSLRYGVRVFVMLRDVKSWDA